VTLSLSRLARRQGAIIVDEITGGKAMPPEVLDQILIKTGGAQITGRDRRPLESHDYQQRTYA